MGTVPVKRGLENFSVTQSYAIEFSNAIINLYLEIVSNKDSFPSSFSCLLLLYKFP